MQFPEKNDKRGYPLIATFNPHGVQKSFKCVVHRIVSCVVVRGRLQTEVVELKKTRDQLKEHLLTSQLRLSKLDRTLSILNQDILVKDNTLLIDSRELTILRKRIHVEPCVGVAFAMPRCQYDCLQPQKCFPDVEKRLYRRHK